MVPMPCWTPRKLLFNNNFFMKRILLLFILLITTAQTIQSQTVVLDTNGVTVKWTGTTVPSPYFVQANPRGTGMEWFAIVDNSTTSNITNYAKNIQTGITYFTRPSTTTPIPFNNIVTTLITNMLNLFSNTPFNQPIGAWDVSNVTFMGGIFVNATAFNQSIGFWNVSNVTNMFRMFGGASTFNQPIGNWNVSNATNMSEMFLRAYTFNQNISSWNVSNVTNMTNMFTDSQLSIANYDALLIGWSTISPNETPLKPNVVFSGGNSNYCNGANARSAIISTYGWTITDAGLNCALDTGEFETNTLKLYPNPVVSVLNVKTDHNFINQTYTIIDGLGRVVLNGKLNNVESAINVEQLSKGIYYIKTAGNSATKFIKE